MGSSGMARGYVLVTHTDIDGVGAAALYIYLYNEKPREIRFYEPYHLDRLANYIRKVRTNKIVITDLGMNKPVYTTILESIKQAVSRGVCIEWYDHHVWDQEWIRGFREAGVKLYIDRSTCATGVVAKHAPSRRREIDKDFVKEVVGGVCAGDLWRFDHWRGPWYLRLVRRREKDSWRLHVIDVLSRGVSWTDEFTENIVSKIEKELMIYNNVLKQVLIDHVDGLRIAYTTYSKIVDTSFIAALLLSRLSSSVAVVASADGKLSFRSIDVDIRELAKALGGGGHPRAAGAKIKIPFRIRLKSLWDHGCLLEYVSSVVRKAVIEINGLKKIS